MRSIHFVAALAVVACLSFASSAVASTFCGSGSCEPGEDCISCPEDCGCDDGVFCNGLESCNAATGECEAVSACPPSIDGCVTRNASCDEDNDLCNDFADDSLCEDGLFCTVDSCDIETGGCAAIDACPAAIIGCLVFGKCDEENDQCLTNQDDSLCPTGEVCTPEGDCIPPVPTATGWGMAAVALLLVTGITIKFGAMNSSRKAA